MTHFFILLGWWTLGSILFTFFMVILLKGYLYNFLCALWVFAGAMADIGFRLFIDLGKLVKWIAGLFRRRRQDIELDEYERKLS